MMIQKLITVILAIMIIIKVLVMMIVMKVMIEFMFYLLKLFKIRILMQMIAQSKEIKHNFNFNLIENVRE